MSPCRLPQFDHSFFRCVCSLTTTIRMFSVGQPTIFPHTFSPQLFRWRYILNVFPCVKYNYSIHILSTIFRVIYTSRFSVCVFCVLIFRSYCNSIFRVVLAPDFSVGVLIACIFIPRLRFIPCRASELFPWRVVWALALIHLSIFPHTLQIYNR